MSNLQSEIEEYVTGLATKKLKKQGDNGDIQSDMSIIGAGGIFDSMEFLTVLSKVERKFSIEIDLSEFEPTEFASISGFAKCCESE